MNKEIFIERWNSVEFVTSIANQLEEVFIQHKNSFPYDFRGIGVGFDSQISALKNASFQKNNLNNIDFTYSKMSCSFIGGRFFHLKFDETLFDSCRMAKSHFINCSFQNSKITADMEDGYFENCIFDNSKLFGRNGLEYGGRRAIFKFCSFKKTFFKRTEFRASKFINCIFEGVVFDKCDLRGAKFEKTQPEDGQLINCLM